MPRHTTPTWEMELLISGATVFALMQLPGLVEGWLDHWLPRFDADAAAVMLLPAVYLKSSVYALIITFILHLATRGYWVALVGLSSVYPGGLRWEGLKWGPNFVRVIRRRMPELPDLIERADNRASQVFGFGLGFALLLLAPLIFVTVMALAAYALFLLSGKHWSWLTLWNLLLFATFAPYFLLVMLDRWFGSRLAPEGRAARALRAILDTYQRLGFSSFVNFPVTLFISLSGQRRGDLIVGSLAMALASFAVAQQFWLPLAAGIGQFGPAHIGESDSRRRLDPQHYADQRDPGDSSNLLPFIASEVVSGDYLRLFVPYRPRRDNPALARACPEFEAEPEEARRKALAPDCLDALYAISLDGRRLTDPRFDRAIDPATGVNGGVAMIRVADLAPGRHELEIDRPHEFPASATAARRPPYRIAFWR